MGSELPKQMLDLCGKPVLRRTVELFLDQPFEVRVIVSINDSIKELWLEYCRKNDFVFPSILITGGITRFHSVRKAMKYLPDGALAAVHDGVRPLLRKEDVAALFEEAEQYPAVVPVIPVADSMRRTGEDGSSVIVFHTEVLKKAYAAAYSPEFTDDASVVEKSGVPLHFCTGSRLNLKLTTPEDMDLARAVVSSGILK